jgi:hypothetical protein
LPIPSPTKGVGTPPLDELPLDELPPPPHPKRDNEHSMIMMSEYFIVFSKFNLVNFIEIYEFISSIKCIYI